MSKYRVASIGGLLRQAKYSILIFLKEYEEKDDVMTLVFSSINSKYGDTMVMMIFDDVC